MTYYQSTASSWQSWVLNSCSDSTRSGNRLTNWVVLSKAFLCILVSSFTKWEESYSGSSRMDAGSLDLPYFLASGKPVSPVPTREDFSFICFLLRCEQSALPTLDLSGWSCPVYKPSSLAAGWSPSHTQKQCYIFICVSSIFSIESSFGFLMFFFKEKKLVVRALSFNFLSSLFLGML